MADELRIPKMGMGMTEGKLVSWFFKDGDKVSEGDVIYSLETEKSVSDIEAPASGTLRILAETDETYDVGALIGRIE
jgi:pyruvate/2-oxoglutarate dehydrogenase complex dihydrolipoamide acyltransferase (E2) component